jgi:hypothetical protein
VASTERIVEDLYVLLRGASPIFPGGSDVNGVARIGLSRFSIVPSLAEIGHSLDGCAKATEVRLGSTWAGRAF